MTDLVQKVGAAILEAEAAWTPKAIEPKERVMALAAIDAMRDEQTSWSIQHEEYQVQAVKYYDELREDVAFAKKMLGEYGKWLIATLTAVHLGGLYLVNSMEAVSLPARMSAMWWLVGGLMLILAAGLSTYANWTMLASQGPNVGMLVNRDSWPKNWPLTGYINFTMGLAITLGVFSALTILGAAFTLQGGITPPAS